jgi:hypothetical protein
VPEGPYRTTTRSSRQDESVAADKLVSHRQNAEVTLNRSSMAEKLAPASNGTVGQSTMRLPIKMRDEENKFTSIKGC